MKFRIFILASSCLIEFLLTQLNITLACWLLNIDSYSVAFWLLVTWNSVFLYVYYLVLIDWFLHRKAQEISQTRKEILTTLENCKWFGIPALIVGGIIGFIHGWRMLIESYSFIQDCTTRINNSLINYLTKVIKRL